MDISLHDVHQALVELGKLRFGEMRVEDAIREIVHTTHAMFDVDGAGLMLVNADQHLRSVAASDDRFAHLEDLQVQHREGPCIDAFEIKELVGAEDLAGDRRWPKFSEAAVARKVRAVLARCPTTRTPWEWSRCCRSSSVPGRPRASLCCWRSPTWPRYS